MGKLIIIAISIWLIFKLASNPSNKQNLLSGVGISDAKYPLRFLGALAVIGICEALLPSIATTGLERSTRAIPRANFDGIPFAYQKLSVGDVSRAAPWLWRLGNLSREEMETRLANDIAILEAKLEKSDPYTEYSPGLLRRLRSMGRMHIDRWTSFQEGLQNAQADLDTLFANGEVTSDAANAFVLDHLISAFSARFQTITSEISNLSAEIEKRSDQAPQGDDSELENLQKRHSALLSDSLYFVQDFDKLKAIRSSSVQLASPEGDLLTDYGRVLTIADATRFQRLHDGSAFTGPDTAPGRPFYAKLRDAVTGQLRHSGSDLRQFKCGISFRSDDTNTVKLNPLCVVSTPLKINYDITAADCSDLDREATSFCIEQWIFPHIRMDFTATSVTIYPPYAHGANQPSELSEWSIVDWQGNRHQLPTTISLPDEPNYNSEFDVWHSPKQYTISPGIWRAFRQSYPGEKLLPKATSPTTAFESVKVDRISINLSEPKGFLDLAMHETRETYLDTELSDSMMKRKQRLKQLSFDYAVKYGDGSDIGALCLRYYEPAPEKNVSKYDDEILNTVVRADTSICEAHQNYIRVLEALSKAQVMGSWLEFLEG